MSSPTSPIAARLGGNLALARERAGISQETLGVMASLHRTEVSLLERGIRLPRIDTAIKLAGALEIPLDALIDGIGWTPGSTTLGAFSLVDSAAQGRLAACGSSAGAISGGGRVGTRPR